jgi:hypothetical protein
MVGELRGALVLLETQIASNSASLTFSNFSAAYDEYEIHFHSVVAVTDNVNMLFRVNGDAGNKYRWGMMQVNSANATINAVNNNAAPSILPSIALGNSTGENAFGILRIANANNTSLYKNVIFDMTVFTASAISQRNMGYATWASASAITSMSTLMSSGNISSGEFRLYGVRKS